MSEAKQRPRLHLFHRERGLRPPHKLRCVLPRMENMDVQLADEEVDAPKAGNDAMGEGAALKWDEGSDDDLEEEP